MSKKDYYNLLELDRNATNEDIKKNYRKMAMKYHPDKNQGNEEASNMFKEISNAYSILSNPDKRREYDIVGDVDDSFDGMEDPFNVFNNIFQQHMHSFMNMQYDDNININSIINNIPGFQNTDLPFGNVHIRVHTFPVENTMLGNIFSGDNKINSIFNHGNSGFNNDNNSFNDNDDNIEDINIGSLFSNIFNKFKNGKETPNNKTKSRNDMNNRNRNDMNNRNRNDMNNRNRNDMNNRNRNDMNNHNRNDMNNKKEEIHLKPPDKIYNVEVSLAEIYEQENKKININRTRYKDGIYIDKKKKIEIPVYAKEILLKEQGDQLKNYKEKGDIIINIFNKKEDNFKRINEYDILTFMNIELNKLYSAFCYELILPNKEVLFVQSEKMISGKTLLQRINNKGIPYKDDTDTWKKGNLYIMYNIIFPENINLLNNIKEYHEETNVNEYFHIAYNCDISEIFME
jgi:DnaJ-class molecular chaperone